jgi:hypothetical protein
MTISESTLLEYRTKNLFFFQGFLSRNHLTLRSYFYPEAVDVTDIDAIGVRFSSNFNPEVVICECKSGESNGTVDRILWLAGLSRYFDASSSMIIRKVIPAKIKRFAQEVGVIPIDYARLLELEKTNGVPSIFLGSCDYDYYEPRAQKYYRSVKDDPQISKIYWFLRSRYWYTENPGRMKQTITALQILSKNPKPEASRWLAYEAFILFSLSLVYLCRDLFPLSESERPEYINNLLTTGVGSPEFSKKVLDATFGLVAAIERDRTGKSSSIDYSKLKIPPPEYSASLIDLATRMIQRPIVSTNVPRFLDFICFEFLFKDRKIDVGKVKELFPSETEMIAKLGKNVAKFVVDHGNIPESMFENLMEF